ncbi:MAG: hypothetical protein LW635_14015, partial [Microcystis sp. 53598_E5]|nr:hypothetical protein [Microcystis sp. 53598_E5]
MAKPHTRTPRRTQVTPNRLADFLAARLAFFSTAISMHPTNLSILVRGYLNAAGIKKAGSCH